MCTAQYNESLGFAVGECFDLKMGFEKIGIVEI